MLLFQVGGNCSVLLQSGTTAVVVVSKSGKLPNKKMDIYEDFAVIVSFDSQRWSCDYYACEQTVLPTSDAPLHCAVLLEARTQFQWSEYPAVVLHGHAFETEQEAAKYGFPISTEETLFSTPEDTQALMTLLTTHPYPKDEVYIRKGHGFLLLAADTQHASKVFEARMKRHLGNS